MKRPKKLTRDQKIMLTKLGYDPKQYLLIRDMPYYLLLQDKKTALEVVIDKPDGRRRTR